VSNEDYDSGDGRWFVKHVDLPTLNFRQFNPQITTSVANEHSNYGANVHNVTMHDANSGEYMGQMEWHAKRGEILNVRVPSYFRRMGVANTLFHHAHQMAREQGLVAPEHSHDRSDMGDAWAKQAGGKVPPRGWISSYSQ